MHCMELFNVSAMKKINAKYDLSLSDRNDIKGAQH